MTAKFCTKCGRPLAEGQICICRQEQPIHTEEKEETDMTAAETVTVQPEEKAADSKPEEETAAAQPKETADSQPEAETAAAQPEEKAADSKPEEETAAAQPEEETADSKPEEETAAAQPKETADSQPEGDVQIGLHPEPLRKEEKPMKGHAADREKAAAWLRAKKDSITAGVKKLWGKVGPLLKNPTRGVQELALSDGKRTGFQLIVINTVAALIVLLILFARINGILNRLGSVLDGYFGIQLPWLQSILLLIVGTLGVDCLEAALLKMLTGTYDGRITMDAAFSIVGQKALFNMLAATAAVVVSLISVPFGVIILVIASVCILIFEYNAYTGIAENTSAKKMYAFMLTKAIVTVAVFFIVYFMISGLLGGVLGTIGTSFGSRVIDSLF